MDCALQYFSCIQMFCAYLACLCIAIIQAPE
jgi:hypothetical protein